MSLTYNVFKYNYVLFFLILFKLHILNICGQTITFHSHSNNDVYDITTIYRITNFSTFRRNKDGFYSQTNDIFLENNYNNSYSIEIHSRTNAIGMPIKHNSAILQSNVKDFFIDGKFQKNNTHSLEVGSTRFWTKKGISVNGEICENRYSYQLYDKSIYYGPYQFTIDQSYCYDALIDDANNLYFKISLSWIPDKEQTCLSITYVHRMNSYFKIYMSIFNENNTLITSTTLKNDEDNIKTLKITNLTLMKKQKYKFVIETRKQDYQISYNIYRDNYYFALLRIAQCSNGEEDYQIVSTPALNSNIQKIHFKPFNTYDGAPENTEIPRYEIKNPELSKQCLNGGFLIRNSLNLTEPRCVCPPGFIGQFCETGCGLNSFGADCKGICSMLSDKMCRGMLMCTYYYGCTCPPGLTGPFCDEDCYSGYYGNNCQQNCSSNCLDGKCDQYTGVCSKGCSSGFIPPLCLEKYPYLKNPPKLLSSKYDAIELQLNFESNNIRRQYPTELQLKYYQLFYKSLKEDKLRTSEIKLINKTNNECIEILNDLDVDTTYMIGVIVISDNGNFNDQDIVYGTYRTSCIEPEITDYNVKLTSGIRSINVTWDKIIPNNRLECNVSDYVLTVMFNQSENQIPYEQEIVSSTPYGHNIINLLPGFQYDIKLTPKTIKGPLQSSSVYTSVPLGINNNVKILDIVTKNEFRTIQVSWKLVNSYQHYATVKEPVSEVTSILRYKLKRNLSCSSNEVDNKWTTVTLFNRTSYNIIDAIPNAQYSIQVEIAGNAANATQQENSMVITDTLTPASNPQTEPIFDIESPIYVTNHSVSVQWKVEPTKCLQLNGLFSKFYLMLKDKSDDTLQIKETKQNYVLFSDLKSNTSYELKIFIKNHIGYNPEHFLLSNFMTKVRNLKPIDDLVVYKKSLKNRMAGLRWSYPENKTLDGFFVSFDESAFTNTQNVSVITPNKCSAWPEYYCHTFYHLHPSNSYTFKIKPKSQDYPEGGEVSSVSFNSIDGLPDTPNNLKINEISDTTATLQWDIPWILNGVLKMFVINVEEVAAIDMNTCCTNITPIEIQTDEEFPFYKYTLTGLKPGSTYSVGVLTVSKSLWYSSPARISITTLLKL